MMLDPFGIAFGTAAISLAVSMSIVLSQGWHGKHTLDHDLDGVQKFHTTAVPRIGGAAIVAAIGLMLLLCNMIAPGLIASHQNVSSALLLLLAAQPAFLAGILEDLTKKISVRTRLGASIISSLIASVLLGATVDELNIWGVDTLLTWAPAALAVTAVVVAGGVNAVNIIDGFNGLAGSTVIVMLIALGAVGWHVGDSLVATLAMLGLGATLGFLLVNYPSGRLFLGDGGAYFLGFWVAEIAVLLLVRNRDVNAWQILSICAYPVIEVLYSIYRRRFVRQASPGAPDSLHLHSLVYRRVVTRFCSVDPRQPWKRNAAVVWVIIPAIATASLLSVFLGQTILGGMIMAAAQVVIYIVIYGRIVRGRWTNRAPDRLSTADEMEPHAR